MNYNPQLTLNLEIDPIYNAEDFLISACNFEAVSWVKRWSDWPIPGILLYGPPGCGKTHLAHVWQANTQAKFLNLKDLIDKNLCDLFQTCKYYILDDLNITHQDEPTLFHLYNLAKEHQASILFLSQNAPSEWPFTLDDLKSRMNAVPAIEIVPPDDEFLKKIAFKLFSDQQLIASEPILQYLLTHGDRSFKGLQTNVAKINTYALANHRNITLPLVRDVLKSYS
ncbi:MAG: AAA family ATPase [Alphaproteobacteria bacterium]|nr:AAA family ATPase [Alphaproteobacteria bacterium]